MAYADAQRYRLGVNYQLLPVNMPACPFHNNHNDGAMNYTIKDEEVRSRPDRHPESTVLCFEKIRLKYITCYITHAYTKRHEGDQTMDAQRSCASFEGRV